MTVLKVMRSTTAMIAVLLAGVGMARTATAQDMPPPSTATSSSDEAYSYLDDADALLDAMGTSPPDSGFRFDDVDCWAWTMADGYLILAEPLGDDYRYFIFAPGDDYPFFVGDQPYAYGFDGRDLAAVYGDNGDLVDPSDDIADGAAWLSDRGFEMKRAMQSPEPVYADDWADSIGWFGAIELRLDTWRSRPGWIRYRAGPGRRHHHDWRTKLGEEGAKRKARADWFDRWRRGGYHGTPQGGGNWVTAPGGKRPTDGAGPGKGKGKWIGRPRPVAPPTPGTKPGWPGRGDGTGGPGRGPRPPRDGKPPVPTTATPPVTLPPPVVVAPPKAGGGGRDRPSRFPPRAPVDHGPVTIVPTAPTSAVPTAPTPAPAPVRGEGRFDRGPGRAIRSDLGKAPDASVPNSPVSRPAPSRLPPPVSVAPRPSFTPRTLVSPPPSPPSSPSPPPPSVSPRVAPSPSGVRSGGSGSSSRGGGGGSRGDGGGRSGGGKSKDK